MQREPDRREQVREARERGEDERPDDDVRDTPPAPEVGRRLHHPNAREDDHSQREAEHDRAPCSGLRRPFVCSHILDLLSHDGHDKTVRAFDGDETPDPRRANREQEDVWAEDREEDNRCDDRIDALQDECGGNRGHEQCGAAVEEEAVAMNAHAACDNGAQPEQRR